MHRIRNTVLMVGVLALLSGLMLTPIATAAPNRYTVPVTGTVVDPDTGLAAGTLTNAQLAISGFDVKNGELVAVGTVTGTLTTLAGEVTTFTQRVVMDATATGTCEILNLTLGPLDLDLLGLVVHLDQVHLTITAESGEGNLLGNLLCAVAGLLDNGGPLTQIASLLDQILQALTR